MKWFGESWGAPICRHVGHAATPVGSMCGHCDAPIREGDHGLLVPYVGHPGPPWVAYHLDCFLASVGITVPGDTVDEVFVRRRDAPREDPKT